uniref:Uncharacterized protein n=1 Tax=Cannabis sativa TaxID=3483 RepID=A0A803QJB0_CANSA
MRGERMHQKLRIEKVIPENTISMSTIASTMKKRGKMMMENVGTFTRAQDKGKAKVDDPQNPKALARENLKNFIQQQMMKAIAKMKAFRVLPTPAPFVTTPRFAPHAHVPKTQYTPTIYGPSVSVQAPTQIHFLGYGMAQTKCSIALGQSKSEEEVLE